MKLGINVLNKRKESKNKRDFLDARIQKCVKTSLKVSFMWVEILVIRDPVTDLKMFNLSSLQQVASNQALKASHKPYANMIVLTFNIFIYFIYVFSEAPKC